MEQIFRLPRTGLFHLASIWAGIETIIALLFLSPRSRLTLHAVKRLGGFDRRFYRTQIPKKHRLFHLLALRHYAVFGERSGLAPSARFNPATYLRINPDVDDAGVPPLWHWLTKGQYECRRVEETSAGPKLPDDIPQPPRLRSRESKAKYAAHIHVHYKEVWDEISAYLGLLRLDLDVFVTLSYRGDETLILKADIEAKLPKAEVHIVENRGRDILPFLTLISLGAFDGYQAVCKLHTKRSTHRVDGERWRRRLLDGILRKDTHKLLSKFLADPDMAIWVADGQLLQSGKWLGENKSNVARLLSRIELKPHSQNPYFPSGSMYWMKPFTLGMLASLQLGPDDFEEESGQLDGTLAHAVERVVGELALASGQKVIETSNLKSAKKPAKISKPAYISAFYLPQYHRTKENDGWWGDGFTEWTGVNSAKRQFDHQLLLKPTPGLGEYDLSDTEVMARQAKLARQSGIDAFCVYHYWFGRKRMLEKPVDQLLASGSADFPFYLCWANESWRRNWDGMSGELLIEQCYPPEFERDLAIETSRYMKDSRYQKPDGSRPRFVIYRPMNLPDPTKNVERLRQVWREIGVGEVELGGVLFHTECDVDPDLLDFWIEMPPHGLVQKHDVLTRENAPKGLNKDFGGVVYDYSRLTDRALDPCYGRQLPKNTIRGVMPSWDNTARRNDRAHIAHGATPAGFRKWLTQLAKCQLAESYRTEIMINAWNEWGEKAMLEPSDRFGDLNLGALREIAELK